MHPLLGQSGATFAMTGEFNLRTIPEDSIEVQRNIAEDCGKLAGIGAIGVLFLLLWCYSCSDRVSRKSALNGRLRASHKAFISFLFIGLFSLKTSLSM